MNDYLAAKSDPDSLWSYEDDDYEDPAYRRPRPAPVVPLMSGDGA